MRVTVVGMPEIVAETVCDGAGYDETSAPLACEVSVSAILCELDGLEIVCN